GATTFSSSRVLMTVFPVNLNCVTLTFASVPLGGRVRAGLSICGGALGWRSCSSFFFSISCLRCCSSRISGCADGGSCCACANGATSRPAKIKPHTLVREQLGVTIIVLSGSVFSLLAALLRPPWSRIGRRTASPVRNGQKTLQRDQMGIDDAQHAALEVRGYL